MLGQVRVLEEDDVVIGARGGDRVPDSLERLLPIVGVKDDIEHTDVGGVGDLGAGQRRGELIAGLEVPGTVVVQQQHFDRVTLGHRYVIPVTRSQAISYPPRSSAAIRNRTG